MTKTRKGRWFVLLVVGSWLCSGGAGLAQDAAPEAPPAEGDEATSDADAPPAVRIAEEVVVRAIRADETAPVTKVEIDAERLEAANYSQEMPFLLAETPGVTSYSESGLQAGAGYSYFSLRGMHQTRVNMTFDGVPLNDPEESAVYFANFGDFASALESIQVQRGVGTSSVGAASYGGTIDFASAGLEENPGFRLALSGGSHGTARASLAAQSGRHSRSAFFARASWQESDGYRERSGIEQGSLYWAGDWRGDKNYLRFTGFSGREKTELAFYAVEPEILERSPRFNPMQPEERDDFGQDLAYLQLSRLLGPRADFAAQLYYSGAQGHFDLWDDPAAKAGLRRYAIDGETWGALLTTTARGERWRIAGGLHGYRFERDHTQDLDGAPQTANTGHKREESGFIKVSYDVGPRWSVFGDLQLRRAEFRYDGSVDLGPVSWSFVNPKLGARWQVRDGLSIYGSYGRAEREPVRNDLLEGQDDVAVPVDLHAVRPEEVRDAELGVEWSGPRHHLAVNLFDMRFRDEIAPTGEQSEIGYAIRRNIPESSRRGFELAATLRPTARWRLRTSVLLARHEIAVWRQVLDVYDAEGNYAGTSSREFRDTPPALSPETILRQSVEWQPTAAVEVALAGRYVGRSYLDNTGQDSLTTPSYTWLELAARADLGRWLRWGAPQLRLQVNNLLDRDGVWPSGYSYPFLTRGPAGDTLGGIPYYYPLAERHFVAGIEWRF